MKKYTKEVILATSVTTIITFVLFQLLSYYSKMTHQEALLLSCIILVYYIINAYNGIRS